MSGHNDENKTWWDFNQRKFPVYIMQGDKSLCKWLKYHAQKSCSANLREVFMGVCFINQIMVIFPHSHLRMYFHWVGSWTFMIKVLVMIYDYGDTSFDVYLFIWSKQDCRWWTSPHRSIAQEFPLLKRNIFIQDFARKIILNI